MRRLLSVLLIPVMAVVLGGCFLFEPTPTDEKLTTYLTDSPVISARFYDRDRENEDGSEFFFEDLEEGRLQELVEKLDSMELTHHSYHTDYFWGDHFGIELALEDGTYLTYDGTQLEHSKVTIDTPYDASNRIKSRFLEVTNCDFWEEMCEFFPEIDLKGVRTGW